MVKLQIVNVNNEEYTLLNVENGQIFNFNISFYGLEKLPQVGDFLSFNSELLNPKYKEYSKSYQFGPIEEVYGREISGRNDIDYIVINYNNETIHLKRFFG